MALDRDYDGTATVAELQVVLEREYYLFVLRDGVRYFVGEDEGANGVYVWPDGEGDDPPIASLGESDFKEDWRADATYREVARSLHAWLNAGV